MKEMYSMFLKMERGEDAEASEAEATEEMKE